MSRLGLPPLARISLSTALCLIVLHATVVPSSAQEPGPRPVASQPTTAQEQSERAAQPQEPVPGRKRTPLAPQSQEKRKPKLPKAIPAVVPAGRVGPKIRIPGGKFDWGSVLQGTKVEHTFKVHNDGDMPLQIFGVRPGCGCTTASFDREIPAGGVGEIRMIMDTSRLRREMRKRSTISCNVPRTPYAEISLGGRVRPLLLWQPRIPTLDGPAGQPMEIQIVLKKGTRHLVEILDQKLRLGNAELVSFTEVQPRSEYHATVANKPGAPAGTTSDVLQVTFKVRGVEHTEQVPIVIENRPSIAIGPRSNIQFLQRDTEPLRKNDKAQVTRELTVTAYDPDNSFEITGIEVENPPEGVFSAQLSPVRENKEYRITVSVLRFVKRSVVRGKLIINTSDAATPRIEVPLYAQYKVLRRKAGSRQNSPSPKPARKGADDSKSPDPRPADKNTVKKTHG
ncbi:MAG: DUF1573 domain-containing protein [Planctomycetota bacterium]